MIPVDTGSENCLARAEILLPKKTDRGHGMNTDDPKLQSAETDLKQLMADVTRAMEKAQQAIARVTSKETAVSAETEATPPSA